MKHGVEIYTNKGSLQLADYLKNYFFIWKEEFYFPTSGSNGFYRYTLESSLGLGSLMAISAPAPSTIIINSFSVYAGQPIIKLLSSVPGQKIEVYYFSEDGGGQPGKNFELKNENNEITFSDTDAASVLKVYESINGNLGFSPTSSDHVIHTFAHGPSIKTAFITGIPSCMEWDDSIAVTCSLHSSFQFNTDSTFFLIKGLGALGYPVPHNTNRYTYYNPRYSFMLADVTLLDAVWDAWNNSV